jgi:predicted Zn-dependent protease
MRATKATFLCLIILALLPACAVNPVTGERELRLISEREEVSLGQQHYAPLRQMQGGDYTLDPGLTRYVNEVGQRVARQSERPNLPYEFVVINSGVPNAWALPGGKIAVNRGLLTEFESEAELAAVLGHEVVHAAARHSARQMERTLLIQAGLIAVAVGASDSRYAGAIVGSAALGAMLISQRYSRSHELEADYHGMHYMKRAGYHPDAAVTLMETFVRLSEGRQSNWLEGMFSSHPPSRDRVEANRRTAAQLGRSGEWHRDRFEQAMIELRRRAPAYEAQAEARKALAEGRHDRAMQLTREAIRLEPREARFHALTGDIYRASGNDGNALIAYRHAAQLEPGYFQHHLQLGMILESRGEDRDARAALARSLDLLPTATGHLHMGHIERRANNRDAAIEHYRTAAQSDSDAGREAKRILTEMGVES